MALHIGPTILVYKYVGHRFTIFSIIQYVLVSIFTEVLPSFPLTHDMLLIAVFGGILGGIGISIALKQNASSGGTDFIAIYFANKFNISTWNYVMIANMGILLNLFIPSDDETEDTCECECCHCHDDEEELDEEVDVDDALDRLKNDIKEELTVSLKKEIIDEIKKELDKDIKKNTKLKK